MSQKELWWVSDLNTDPEVLGEVDFPSTLKIYDTTLRDGEQTIGVVFDKEEKLQIAKMLDKVGVDRIEAGMPVVSQEDKLAVQMIVDAGLNAEVWGFCRSLKGDVDACIETGVKHIICEIATSPYKMKAYDMSTQKIMDKVLDCLKYAKEKDLYTAFFAVDATRADMGFLEELYCKAVEEGKADEVVMVDTLGVAHPETMYYLTKKLKGWVDVPVMAHCHNDFAMATACTMACVKAGADCVHVTVNGMGEKTGNADIAETVLAAKSYGVPVNLNMKKLYDLAKLGESVSGIPISPLKPVVGENVFKRESGVTAAQLISYPPAVEGFSPEILGREREVLLSKKSGKRSVTYWLEKIGVQATSEQTDKILAGVKAKGIEKKGVLSKEEFASIVDSVVKN